MTTADLIDGILDREGGFQADAADSGNAGAGATNWGITSGSWGQYRGLHRPATRAEIKAITRDEAVEFYRAQLASSPFARITYEPLMVQCIDFGTNSGTARAARWLQRILQVPVTGAIDARTLAALNTVPNRLVHEALIASRVRMIVKAVDAGSIAPKFQDGLIERAVGFSEVTV